MTKLTVSDAVCAAFPHLRIDAILAQGFSGHEPWPEVAERLGRLEADAAAGYALPVDDDPHIASWRAAYCYNLVSVSSGIPAGAFDLSQVTEHSEDIVFVLETV